MNNIVIDHEPTKKAIARILEIIKGLLNAFIMYTDEMDKTKNNTMYSNEHIKGMIDDALEKFVMKISAAESNIIAAIGQARKSEDTNNESYDISDVAFNSALNIINSLGENLTTKEAGDIVKSFKGQVKLLENLKKIIEGKGVLLTDDVKIYFYNSDNEFDELESMVYAMVSNYQAITRYFDIVKKCEHINNVMNLGIPETAFDMGETADNMIRDLTMRMAMGLA